MQDDSFLSSIVPDRVRQAMAQVHDAEAQQLLRDLGYLGASTDANAMLLATQAFRGELVAFSQADPKNWNGLLAKLPYFLPQWDDEAPLNSDEIQMLQQLTSLEGDFELGDWEAVMQDDLCLRVLRHRLYSLGFHSGETGATIDVLVELQALAAQLRTTNLLDTARLAGDHDALVEVVLAESGDDLEGLIFFSVQGEHEGGNKTRFQARGASFGAGLQARISAQGYAAFQEEIYDLVGDRRASKALADRLLAEMARPRQRLLRRLLQLRLWHDGFLEVAPTVEVIEGGFAPESWEAILQLLAIRKDWHDEASRDLLLVHVHEGVWALNAAYFWGELSTQTSTTTPNAPWQDVQALFAAEADRAYPDLSETDVPLLRAKVVNRLDTHAETVIQAQSSPFPVGGSERGLKRVLGWIMQRVDNVGQAFHYLLDHMRGGTSALFKMLKRGFDTLERSIQAILHPPTIRSETNAEVITTCFGLGFAAVTHLDRFPSVEAIRAHGNLVGQFVSHCSAVLHLLVEIVNWGIALGGNPISWVQVGMQILRHLQS